MTMDVTMSLVSGLPARGGERGGKDAEAAGFGEMLAGRTDKRMPKETRGKDAQDEADKPAQWRLGGYDARLALAMPRLEQSPAGMDDAPEPEPEAPQPDPLDAALAAFPTPTAEEATDETKAVELPAAPAPRQRGDKARAAAEQVAAATPADEAAETEGEGEAPRAPAANATDAAVAAPARASAAGAPAGPAPAKPSVTSEPAADRQARPPADTAETAAERQPRPAAPRPASEGVAAARAQPAGPQAADGAQPRVSVLGFSTAMAPAASAPLGPTAAGLVAALEAEPAWRAAAAEAAASAGPRAPQPGTVSTLRIQLNPAELGMVTARLTATGSQLEIEIRVESNDARQRLTSDSDAILKALRAVGFDIDRVTIQQAPQAGGPAAQHQGNAGRDVFAQGQQADDNAGGRNGRESEGGERAARQQASDAAADRAGGGLYI